MANYEFDSYTKKEILGVYKEPEKVIPIMDKVDVLVVGGSASGVAAALAAARKPFVRIRSSGCLPIPIRTPAWSRQPS